MYLTKKSEIILCLVCLVMLCGVVLKFIDMDFKARYIKYEKVGSIQRTFDTIEKHCIEQQVILIFGRGRQFSTMTKIDKNGKPISCEKKFNYLQKVDVLK